MNSIKYLLILFLFVVTINAQKPISGKVTKILDGQTFILETPENVKYKVQPHNIEIPEDESFRNIVKGHLVRLLLNKKVVFECTKIIGDLNIGKVILEEVDISQQLLRDGAAWYFVQEDNNQSSSEIDSYLSLETTAKDEKRGLWQEERLLLLWSSNPKLKTHKVLISKRLNFNSKRVILNTPYNTPGGIDIYSSDKPVYVNGYTRSNGTYVAPYYRSAPGRGN